MATATSKCTQVNNVLSEDVLSVPQAQSELFKLLGRRLDKSTLYRWMEKGTGGVKLEYVKIGRFFYTSKQAIHRFITAANS